jgi:uncharacterized protein YneF (UPF0154 family)
MTAVLLLLVVVAFLLGALVMGAFMSLNTPPRWLP